MSGDIVVIDLPKDDVQLLLAALKVAEVTNGDEQHWDVAKNIGKLHLFIQKQLFNYERE